MKLRSKQIFRLRKKFKNIFFENWLGILLIVVFLLRLPSLFEAFTYGDEGIYLTLGQAVRRGLILYRDLHDNKPPLIYLIAALTQTFSLYRLFAFLYGWLTLFLFYRLARRLFSAQKTALVAACFAFGILFSLPFLEGNIANAENFLIGLSIPGFYLLIKKPARFSYVFSGLLFSLATLFKVPAAFDFLAAMVFVFFTHKKLSRLLTVNSLLLAGFMLPVLASFAYFWSHGALREYFTAAFAQNFPYLASWSGQNTASTGLPLAFLARGLILFLVTLFIFLLRHRLNPQTLLISLWLAFALFAALLSGRPYPHYLLQVVPPLSLALGFFFLRPRRPTLPLLALLALVVSWGAFRFWFYPNFPYYFDFYHNRFTSQFTAARPLYQTAAYLRQHTLSDEKTFLWSNQASLYPLAHRSPLGRYAVAYHIIDFNGYQETLHQLTAQPPRYLVIDQNEKRPFPDLFSWLKQKYFQETKFGPFNIYRRLSL
ncbi:MAG: glycosyltransferase family 39 protein [Candidatus Shapirobacteria bacterium]